MIISKGDWQVKRVSSSTEPLVGYLLSDAIQRSTSVAGQTEVRQKAGRQRLPTGSSSPTDLGLIRAKLWVGDALIADSGDIIDNGPDSLKGGRLGVYCDSQENIIWSALSYRCWMV